MKSTFEKDVVECSKQKFAVKLDDSDLDSVVGGAEKDEFIPLQMKLYRTFRVKFILEMVSLSVLGEFVALGFLRKLVTGAPLFEQNYFLAAKTERI